MNCKTVQTLLSAYLDEELSGREMLELRSHLNECDECAEELRCIEVVKRVIGGSPVPEPSADFESKLITNVLTATCRHEEQKKISLLTLSGIAAASMLATMLLLNSLRSPAPVAPDQHDTMPMELIQRDRAFSASTDPLGGSPVVFNTR